MNDNEEIIQQEMMVPALASETLIAIADQADRRMDAVLKIKKVALKATNARDWADQNGNPYLQVSGSEKVGRIFGVSWRIDEPICELLEGGHFQYTYQGEFSLAGAIITAIGTRSSKDPFFKRYAWGKKDADGNSEKTELPPSEIDKGDVKKAAYTNCIGNGITRLLGIRSLTWADLQEFAGISQEQVMRVEYKDKGKKKDEIETEGAQTVTCAIADVRKQTKKKDGTLMKSPLFNIISTDNKEYKTFSESLAKLAKEAKDAGVMATITFEETKYGFDLKTLLLCVPDEKEEERNLGEEG